MLHHPGENFNASRDHRLHLDPPPAGAAERSAGIGHLLRGDQVGLHRAGAGLVRAAVGLRLERYPAA